MHSMAARGAPSWSVRIAVTRAASFAPVVSVNLPSTPACHGPPGFRPEASGIIMAVEQLTYIQIAEHLGINAEAARGLVRRHRLPRSTANDGKTLIAIDFREIQHRKASARKPAGVQAESGSIAQRPNWALIRIAALESELAAANERAGGFRAAFEREKERADRLMTLHDAMVGELASMRTLLESRLEAGRRKPWWRRLLRKSASDREVTRVTDIGRLTG
jgi:hypothetical protein